MNKFGIQYASIGVANQRPNWLSALKPEPYQRVLLSVASKN